MDLLSFMAGCVTVLVATAVTRIQIRLFSKFEEEKAPLSIVDNEVEEEKEEEPMKKIPAKYTLSEDDIKEAIKEWLYNNHDVEDNGIVVTFQVETKQEQPDTPYRGGMSDWVDKTIITATAEEID